MWKHSKGRPLLRFWVDVADQPPLEHRLRELVLRKATKLTPHASAGRIRVLLLESIDGVNMSETKMLEALRLAFNGMPEGIDRIWFVDSGFDLEPEFFDFTRLLERSGAV